jgi:polyhydroxyalkanoate synthesis regulator phasin
VNPKTHERKNTMSENSSSAEMNKYLFVNLVTMLSMSAMQQLGKLVNPAAGKAEINLDAAQATIDTLDMLAAKTSGNLDKDEARLMKDTLSTLKLNFVETRSEMQRSEVSDQPVPPKRSGEGGKSEVNGQNQESKPQGEDKKAGGQEESKQTADGKTETEDPKFHKSYG